MKIILLIISTNLVTNSLLSVLSFRRNEKQESNLQHVGDMVTKSISVFVYSKSCSTSKVCRIQ